MPISHEDFTARDVEVYARAVYDIILALDIQDGHSKMYDPMKIVTRSDGTGIAHSYVFDLWDGGRHHEFKNLEQVWRGILKEGVDSILADFECRNNWNKHYKKP